MLEDDPASRSTPGLVGNISTIATVGLAAAVPSGIPAVLRVWGVWALVAGLVQLVVPCDAAVSAASGR